MYCMRIYHKWLWREKRSKLKVPKKPIFKSKFKSLELTFHTSQTTWGIYSYNMSFESPNQWLLRPTLFSTHQGRDLHYKSVYLTQDKVHHHVQLPSGQFCSVFHLHKWHCKYWIRPRHSQLGMKIRNNIFRSYRFEHSALLIPTLAWPYRGQYSLERNAQGWYQFYWNI